MKSGVLLKSGKSLETAAVHRLLTAPLLTLSTLARRHSSTTIMADAATPSDAAAIVAQKRALRTKIRSSLRALSLSQRRHEDAAIQEIVLNSPWFKSSNRLCAYISCDSLREVDTSRIISEILSPSGDSPARKKVYVPRVEDKNSHMRMFHISRLNDLVANSMNILEPSPVGDDGNPREDVMVASNPVDLFLVPGEIIFGTYDQKFRSIYFLHFLSGLAFDRSGQRLGRGGGYYDTLLRRYQALCTEKQWKRPLLIALAYSAQILDEGIIPVDAHDFPVDALVSPSGAIPISAEALQNLN